MSKQSILTLDIGTTAVKVSLFTDTLVPLCSQAEEYELNTLPGNRIELDPEVYLQKIRRAMIKIQQQMEPETGIAAIGITTQGETLIPVDAEGRPLHPAILWLDSRAEAEAGHIREYIPEEQFYTVTGLPQINGALPLAKLRYIREKHPEIYQKTHKFLLVEDFILHWLTGRFVSEKSLQCSTGYFSLHTDGYWEQALEAAEIDIDKLPELLDCGEIAGTILPERARELSLSPHTVVVTGAMDQTAAALAAGCAAPGRITETTGTALVLAAFTENPDFGHPSRVTVYRHALNNCFIYLPIGITAGMALKWFKDNFCSELTDQGQMAYKEMDAMAAGVPAGCDGLITLPYFAGCINPEALPNAKAVFYGATLDTSRAHFIRSIMEAAGFMLRDFIRMLGELGCEAKEIYSIGGGSRSRLWQQIKADICQKEFTTVQFSEMSSAGAAMLAAWGAGILERGSCPVFSAAEKFVPEAENKDIYDRTYKKYKLLGETVKELYREDQR